MRTALSTLLALIGCIRIVAANPDPATPYPEFPDVTLTPLPAAGIDSTPWTASLDGRWKFQAQAPADVTSLTAAAIAAWESIEVPGQWYNQGHDLPAGQTVAYATTFERPAGWQDQVVKVRFEAVFSVCRVYLNGGEIGGHLGGFTPFECDLTSNLRASGNLLVLSVTSDSLADRMASASKYACHPLGGISRSVTLFAVPQNHISDIMVRTDFDSAYKDATLEVTLEIDSTHAPGPGAAAVEFELSNSDLDLIDLPNAETRVTWSQPGRTRKTFTFPIAAPLWWTPETPHTYQLNINCGGHRVRQNVGFRKIEVKGTRVLVNGRPVKLRGINRHETDPLRGRSLAPDQWRKDVQLFRDANVNLIRTCHYPPAHPLVEAADNLGVWVEVESPFCWENGSSDPTHRDVALRQVAEMIKRDRNNPSVLYWSLGNESTWGPNFELASKMVRELDPTRPQTFEWTYPVMHDADAAQCEIGVVHYPGFNGPVMARETAKRPLFMGEYCHLNAYNRRELMTDPGLRDRWGLYLHRLWEQMDAEPNILGGAIWSGIDDTFFVGPDLTLGYGAWGPLDGWRRPKPEYWHVKKTYSPVRIDESKAVALTDGTLTIPVENRSDFVNLSEFKVRWSIGDQSGTVRADAPSRQHGVLSIKPAHEYDPFQQLSLSFHDPRGFETNRFLLSIGDGPLKVPELSDGDFPRFTTTSDAYQIIATRARWSINRKTGMLTVDSNAGPVVTGGPHLMLVPSNSEGDTQMTGKTKIHDSFSPVCSDWQLKEVRATQTGDQVRIEIEGAYAEAEGVFVLEFIRLDVEFSYHFTVKRAINPRQTGVAFDFPLGFDRLTWTRRGLWSVYPDDHIGRLSGTALAVTPDGKPALEIGPRENPGASPWANDNTCYGSNDFRSTKENIITARLAQGPNMLQAGRPACFWVGSDASQSVRAWLEPVTKRTWLLIANFTSGGSERFLQGLVEPDQRPLKPGDSVAASFHIAAQ